MTKSTLFIDAGAFLGMHHQDETIRLGSLAFFQSHFESRRVCMNYEQIGICDAIIWQQSRQTQDLYYPFMDRLHSDMQIHRGGYTFSEISWALEHQAQLGLPPEQALLVAQVALQGGILVTHVPALRKLPMLRSRLWDFGDSTVALPFPSELQALYEASRHFVYSEKELADG